MNMAFSKEKDECKVLLKDSENNDYEFSYIKMIDLLYREKKFDETEFGDGFTEEEMDSINNLVIDINSRIEPLLNNEGENIS